jgi:hypothetical protein
MALRLRATEEHDLDYVLELEADPDASVFIIPWSRRRHRQALTDPDEEHLLVLDEERPLGFVLLSGFGDPNYGVELRRIVIERKGGGLGRRAIEMVLDRAFAEHGAHRVWLDVMLHNSPKKLGAALQEQIDAVAQPSFIIVGYGLCGNGLVGVNARQHTLIIPRTHDCVAIFLGSHQRYVQRFFANPNTYYLTKGWIDARDEPLSDYLDYVKEFDEETADYLFEMKYKHYRKICLVGFSQQELDDYRGRARAVADFMGERVGAEVVLEETLGSTGLIETLIDMGARQHGTGDEFVVVAPGGEITQDLFMRPGEAAPQPMARKEAAA